MGATGFLADVAPFAGPAGGLLSAGLNLLGSSNAQAASAEAAQVSFDEARQMSNTAHQREVTDLTRAGLNPILSVNRSGASTPSGVMNPMAGAVGTALAGSADQAFSAMSQLAGLKKTAADTAVSQAQAANVAAQTLNTSADTANKAQQLKSLTAAAQYAPENESWGAFQKRWQALQAANAEEAGNWANKFSQMSYSTALASQRKSDIDADWYNSNLGQISRRIELAGNAAKPAADAVGSVIGSARKLLPW